MNRKSRLAFSVMRIESLEPREVPTALLGLTASNALVTFDSSRPDLLSQPVAINGLKEGDSVVAIDSRPATGTVFALGVNGPAGRLYTIDPASGNASLVGLLPGTFSTAEYDIDFTPDSQSLRLVGSDGTDLRIDPEELSAALKEFDSLWEQLSSEEQARIVYLLIQRVDYDGSNGSLVFSFRPEAARLLAAGQSAVSEATA